MIEGPSRIGNCLIWALAARKRTKGSSYLIVRPSLSRWYFTVLGWEISGRIPHFLVGISRGHYHHIVSFVPDVRPDRPTLIYIALFRGRMRSGDAHAPGGSFTRDGRGHGMLKAAIVVCMLIVMFFIWLGWWIYRIGRWIVLVLF